MEVLRLEKMQAEDDALQAHRYIEVGRRAGKRGGQHAPVLVLKERSAKFSPATQTPPLWKAEGECIQHHAYALWLSRSIDQTSVTLQHHRDRQGHPRGSVDQEERYTKRTMRRSASAATGGYLASRVDEGRIEGMEYLAKRFFLTAIRKTPLHSFLEICIH